MNITAEDTIEYYQLLPDAYYDLNINQRGRLDWHLMDMLKNGVSINRATDEISDAIRLYCVMAARLGVEL